MSLVFAALILSLFCSSSGKWISHTENTTPRDDTMSAIGSYNGSIYLLGGFDKNRQLTNYDIKTDSFVFYKSGFIPINNKVFGEAQFWTQIGHNIYFLNDLDAQNNKISVYNMQHNTFISDFDSIPVTMSDGMGRSCIASSSTDNKIFINGGITNTGIPMAETTVLNIDTMSWGLASQMQIARRSHSCIIHPHNQILYSIGGSSTTALTSTIEKISIVTIHDNKWTYVTGSLHDPSKGLRSFIYGDNIIIIGGVDDNRGLYDTIHIIDTTTNTLSISNTTLAFKTGYAASIMVNNIMYAFGGGFAMDEWQSYAITISPTRSPTTSPITTTTTATSHSPTTAIITTAIITTATTVPTGTLVPTSPTISPITRAPTTEPTVYPTTEPTTEPTMDPTVEPTITAPSVSSTYNTPTIEPIYRTDWPGWNTTQLEEKQEGSWSKGAKVAGVGFAVALIICLLLVVAFFCIRDRRVKDKQNNEDEFDDHETVIETNQFIPKNEDNSRHSDSDKIVVKKSKSGGFTKLEAYDHDAKETEYETNQDNKPSDSDENYHINNDC